MVFAFRNELVEENLAQNFGVERHTVHEAFVHLEEIGLVEQIPSRGVFVREPSPKEVRDIYAVRSPCPGPAGPDREHPGGARNPGAPWCCDPGPGLPHGSCT